MRGIPPDKGCGLSTQARRGFGVDFEQLIPYPRKSRSSGKGAAGQRADRRDSRLNRAWGAARPLKCFDTAQPPRRRARARATRPPGAWSRCIRLIVDFGGNCRAAPGKNSGRAASSTGPGAAACLNRIICRTTASGSSRSAASPGGWLANQPYVLLCVPARWRQRHRRPPRRRAYSTGDAVIHGAGHWRFSLFFRSHGNISSATGARSAPGSAPCSFQSPGSPAPSTPCSTGRSNTPRR